MEQRQTPPRPEIDCEKYHACFAVDDVAAAIDFYVTKLGFTHARFAAKRHAASQG